MEKWKTDYESYINGGLEEKENELKAKYESKEIDIREYEKEKKRVGKIKSNLPYISNLMEMSNELEELKNEIERELIIRHEYEKGFEKIADKISENEKEMKILEGSKSFFGQVLIEHRNELNKEIEELRDAQKEYDQLLKEGQDSLILKNKIKNLHRQIAKRKEEIERSKNNKKDRIKKLSANNIEFTQYKDGINRIKEDENKSKNKRQLSNIEEKDLKEYYKKICIKNSVCNFYAKRLIKGYNVENVKEKAEEIDWQNRKRGEINIEKLIAKRKDINKLQGLKEAAKTIGNDQQTQDLVAQNVQEFMDKKEPEHKDLIPINEFEQKHPILSKIKNIFRREPEKTVVDEKGETQSKYKKFMEKLGKQPIVSKIKNIFNKEEVQQDDKTNSQEKKEPEKTVEQKETVVEEKGETQSKHKNFVARLKKLDNYEMYDVATRGIDQIEHERIEKIKNVLGFNKEKHKDGLSDGVMPNSNMSEKEYYAEELKKAPTQKQFEQMLKERNNNDEHEIG